MLVTRHLEALSINIQKLEKWEHNPKEVSQAHYQKQPRNLI